MATVPAMPAVLIPKAENNIHATVPTANVTMSANSAGMLNPKISRVVEAKTPATLATPPNNSYVNTAAAE